MQRNNISKMKKSISILMLLVTISSVGFASRPKNPTTGAAVLQNGSTIKLLYRAEQLSNVKIQILNEKNEIVLTERLKNVDGFLRPYNFSELPAGEYSFVVTDARGSQIEKISYSEKIKPERIAKLMPVAGNDKKLLLSVPNKQRDIITISILDEAGNVLYSEKEAISDDFAKIYNLEVFKGKMRFHVVDSKGNVASLVR
jgi:hypothetical protein